MDYHIGCQPNIIKKINNLVPLKNKLTPFKRLINKFNPKTNDQFGEKYKYLKLKS